MFMHKGWCAIQYLAVFTIPFLAGCASQTPVPTKTATMTGLLTPFHTLTPSLTSLPPTPLATIPLTPAPSATPFTHTIATGDTMLGIAIQYGVTLEDLKAANPGVDPGLLTIGTSLIIPLGGEIPENKPAGTPQPVACEDPVCYPTRDEGLWCLMLVENDQTEDVENLSAWIGLFSAQGENVAGQMAITPLNLLRVGNRMPLVAFFPPPVKAGLMARGELLTALAVTEGEDRYLKAQARIDELVVSPGGEQARLRGVVYIPEGSVPSLVWLAAVAYDQGGNVIGVRKWESLTPCGLPVSGEPGEATTPGTQITLTTTGSPIPAPTQAPMVACIPYELTVYSLGPAIDRVELLAEAIP